MTYRTTLDFEDIKSILSPHKVLEHLGIPAKRRGQKSTCPACRKDDGFSVFDNFNGKCHRRSCAFVGDIFDIIGAFYSTDDKREQFNIAAGMAGISTHNISAEQQQRIQEAQDKRDREERARQRRQEAATLARPGIMERLWHIVKEAPLSDQVKQWLEGRGIDPDHAYKLGVRDWSTRRRALQAFVGDLTDDQKRAAGLVNGEGKLWSPLYSGRPDVMIPCWHHGDAAPWSWRRRLIKPTRDRKTLAQPSGDTGHTHKASVLGQRQAHGAAHIVVVEGEPDYLSATQLLQHVDDVGVIGLLTITHKQWDQLFDALPNAQRITLAVHHDRDKETNERKPLNEHKPSLDFANWLAETDRSFDVMLLDVPGEPDLNDHHKEGDTAWFVEAIKTGASDRAFAPCEVQDLIEHARALAHPEMMANPFDGQARLTIDEASNQLDALYPDLLGAGQAGEGLHLLAIDTEVGKSTGLNQSLINHITSLFERSMHDQDTYILTLPTHDLCLEQLERWIEHAPNNSVQDALVFDAGRRAEQGDYHCPNHAEYTERAAIAPCAGSDFCFHECNYGQNDDLKCPWRERTKPSRHARVILRTHQMHQNRLLQAGEVKAAHDREIRWIDCIKTMGYTAGFEGTITRDERHGAHTYKAQATKNDNGKIILHAVRHPHGLTAPDLSAYLSATPDQSDEGYNIQINTEGKRELARWMISTITDDQGDEYQTPLAYGPIDPNDPTSTEAMLIWRRFANPDYGRVIIHDEDILGTIKHTTTIPLDTIHLMMGEGMITDDQGRAINKTDARWSALVQWCEGRKDGADRKSNQKRLETITNATGIDWPALGWSTDAEQGYIDKVIEAYGRGEKPNQIATHDQREAIKQAIERQGAGVAIHPEHGLSVLHTKPMLNPGAKTTLLLDATAHEKPLRLLLQDFPHELTAHHIRAQHHKDTQITRIETKMGSAGDIVRKTRDDQGRALEASLDYHRLKAIHNLTGDKKTLHIIRKAYAPDALPNDEQPSGAHLLFKQYQQGGDEVMWHCSTDSKGSNKYEYIPCVIADPWFKPGAVVDADAELYQWHAQQSDDPALRTMSFEHWRSVALWEHHGAPYLQAVMRCRSRRNPRTIFYCAPYDIPGIEATQPPITEDALAMMMFLGSEQTERLPQGIAAGAVRWLLKYLGKLPLHALAEDVFSTWIAELQKTPNLSNHINVLQFFSDVPVNAIYISPIAFTGTGENFEFNASHVQKIVNRLDNNKLLDQLTGARVVSAPTVGASKHVRWLVSDGATITREEIEEAARSLGARSVEIDGEQVHLVDLDWSCVDWSARPPIVWGQIQALMQVDNHSTARRALIARGLPTSIKKLKEAVAPVEALPELDLSAFDSEEAISKIAIMRHYNKSRWADAAQCLKNEGYDGTLDELREFWREDREEDQAIKDERTISRYSVVDERPTAPRHVKTPELLQAAGSPAAPRPVWDDDQADNLPEWTREQMSAYVDELFGPRTPAEVAKTLRGVTTQLEKSRKGDVLTFRAADPHLQPLEHAFHQWSNNPWIPSAVRMTTDFDAWCAHLRLHVGDWSFDLLPVGPRRQWIENTIKSAIDSLIRDERVPVEQLACLDGQWRIDDHDAGLEPVGVGWYLPIDQAA